MSGRPCQSRIPQHRDEIVAALRQGRSYTEIARRLGVSRDLLRYYALQWGERSRRANPPTITVEHAGERVSLWQLAGIIGIDYHTLYHRYRNGDRGERLVRKPKPAPKPRTYVLGISLAQWREYAGLAREIGVANVARKTGLPRGAVNAAVRGEWERLE